MRKGWELHKKADEFRSRAASIQNNDAIYSDNPQAVELLDDKLQELLAEQTEVKRINAALRKGADFFTLEMSEEHRLELLSVNKHQGYYQPLKKGFPPYMLTSLSTKIRTAKKRSTQVEKKQAMFDEDLEFGGIKVEGRPSENRLRVIFPARVTPEMYKLLRSHGYRSTKVVGTFSAFYNNNALWFIKQYIKKEITA